MFRGLSLTCADQRDCGLVLRVVSERLSIGVDVRVAIERPEGRSARGARLLKGEWVKGLW